jgi:hypothetical protein
MASFQLLEDGEFTCGASIGNPMHRKLCVYRSRLCRRTEQAHPALSRQQSETGCAWFGASAALGRHAGYPRMQVESLCCAFWRNGLSYQFPCVCP